MLTGFWSWNVLSAVPAGLPKGWSESDGPGGIDVSATRITPLRWCKPVVQKLVPQAGPKWLSGTGPSPRVSGSVVQLFVPVLELSLSFVERVASVVKLSLSVMECGWCRRMFDCPTDDRLPGGCRVSGLARPLNHTVGSPNDAHR